MKAISLSVAFEVASGIALAQGLGDPMTHLRACSLLGQAERLECLDKLSRSMEPPDRPAQGSGNWTVSETTSPVNYTPIVTATASSHGGSDGSSMQLSIHCRGGRTELVVFVPAVSGDFIMSYRVNDGQPVQMPAGAPSFGTGIAFKGDVERMLLSLPEEGGLVIRLLSRTGAAHDGHFPLGGLTAVRDKVAAACRWSRASVRSRNQ